MHNTISFREAGHTVVELESAYLGRNVELEIFFPAGVLEREEVSLLLLNDGQDSAGLLLKETLTKLYQDRKMEPTVVVAIGASSLRLLEYGVAGIPDFKGRGSMAADYTKFITGELIPFLEAETGRPFNGRRAFAGCSLGGLAAFDIAWKSNGLFDTVGVFSGSFWWRSKDLEDGYTDEDRIMHKMIRETEGKPELKFWLMAGTEDEVADRNHNFIIDSIDDTIDIIKELIRKGYNRPEDICYYEMVGGQHNIGSWAKVLPSFLTWAFGGKTY